MKNILVFFGGVSTEHDVSIITGTLTVNSLDKNIYNGIPIYIDFDGKWYTGEILKNVDEYKNLDIKKLKRVCLVGGENILYYVKNKKIKPLYKIYSAINCLHGINGEDGSISSICTLNKIPFCSPNMLSSSIFMDKEMTKHFLTSLGVKCLDYQVFTLSSENYVLKENLQFPVIIKPARLGSSIGIEIAKNTEELYMCCKNALRYDSKVIIENCLNDYTEINCAIYKNSDEKLIISQLEKPISNGNILTFNDKYALGKREFPAKIDKDIENKIKTIIEKIYSSMDIAGVIRCDFFIVKDEVIVNEVNTVPGSLSYYLFSSSLNDFSKMLDEMIKASIKKFNLESQLITYKNTGILKSVSYNGIKS